MSSRLIKLLIIGQVLIDIAFVVYMWLMRSWSNQVSEILETLLRDYAS